MDLPDRTSFTHLDSCSSTIEEARRRLRDQEAGSIVLVASDHQTAGRGRRDGSWDDVPGSAVLVTAGLVGSVDGGEVSGLDGLVAELLRRRLVERYPLLDGSLEVKPPNDLVTAAGKLAGVLVSTHFEGDSCRELLLSVGLNVSAAPELAPGTAPATTLSVQVGEDVDVAEALSLVADVLIAELAYLRRVR